MVIWEKLFRFQLQLISKQTCQGIPRQLTSSTGTPLDKNSDSNFNFIIANKSGDRSYKIWTYTKNKNPS